MEYSVYKQLILIALFIFTAQITSAETTNMLSLEAGDKKIEHKFHLTISKSEFKKLGKLENVDRECISKCDLTYNSDSLDVKEIELRGKSSLNFKRKSFSVKLNKKIKITKDGKTHKLKKFNLISLSMDHHYFRNKVAFDIMNQLDLFNLLYTYAEVIINGKTQGVYLLVQKPKNYAFKKEKANFMLRRDYDHEINKTYYKGDDSTNKAEYINAYTAIYNEVMQKNGKEFYDELSKLLDVEQYFKWMAINFLIGNKDYTDEVFFYNKAKGDKIKFGIIPWDYDDIFFDNPHEGYIIRKISFGDKLAFSSEDALDFKLIADDYTYVKYLETLSKVIQKVNETELQEIFKQTYIELDPFFKSKEILKVSRYDKYGKTDLKSLEANMQHIYQWMIEKRTASLTQLNKHHINL